MAGITRTEPPCAYVLRQAGGITVAAPAVVILTPPEEAQEQPIRIRLDAEGQVVQDSSDGGRTCEHLGVSTPAVSIRLSTSAFAIPGALVATPTIAIQLSEHIWSAPGHVLQLRGGSLLLPVQRLQDAAPLSPITEPSLFVDIDGELRTARFLVPRAESETQSGSFPPIQITGDPNKSARINPQEKERSRSPGTPSAPPSAGRKT
ncbi:hypothetical protein DAT35_05150 [Vitiosangium sp. GDMCC 1.1324]|nr:hypothetical protein DAT35_05150 [Vitiosangium sp. GDMCC 1.1324]